jgi:hypothetical protein
LLATYGSIQRMTGYGAMGVETCISTR